jgi:hypothetical protein
MAANTLKITSVTSVDMPTIRVSEKANRLIENYRKSLQKEASKAAGVKVKVSVDTVILELFEIKKAGKDQCLE